jgi:hypothetical protein
VDEFQRLLGSYEGGFGHHRYVSVRETSTKRLSAFKFSRKGSHMCTIYRLSLRVCGHQFDLSLRVSTQFNFPSS